MEQHVMWVFLFLLCWVHSVPDGDGLLSPKGVNYEVAALMSVKREMIDDRHVMEGWDINSVDPCTWNMVACSAEGFVISLEMASTGLSDEIGKLSEFQTLDLSGNQFVGAIPSSLGSLTHLSYLRLSNNNLSGLIPRDVANLTGLLFLDLSFNNLSGPTPKILANDYSITGNNFLCTSSFDHICGGVSNPLNVQQDYDFEIGHLKSFSYRELQIATGNFNPQNILGQGGYGVVYKGCLPNSLVVAVKRLKDPNFTGEVQFQTEVEMIGLALHRNLLRLYGFCMTPDERLLVYPYMPNRSVADCLRDSCHGKPTLNWNRRMHIALGAARGLLYLHEQCNPKIIHRDVKAANILIDESFEAVVGDFGLAKLLDKRDSHVTTAVRGTVGHIAPEYLSTGQSSEKTDVFGFGILLLELITGQKTLDDGNGQIRKGMILNWVKTLHEEKRLEALVDRDLKGCFNAIELETITDLALKCTRSQPHLRPKMSEVLKVLEGLVQSGAEESQGRTNHCETRAYSFARNYSNVREESSFIIEAVEFSGPR
ncbi:hypothetical protein V6N11_048515 [Hibiscus sabdariffa]|uniref:Protein kinase domain-containing protein n=1 Tax=Hibiscus sabdariffa TaxID=183260 RepID=A0ABR2PVY6_9ROSI